MRIKLATVYVDDQAKALRFYTEMLGFVTKVELSRGKYMWLTVVSPEDPDGAELVLEPDDDPATKAFKKAFFSRGLPVAAFRSADVRAERERLGKLGVRFTLEPQEMGPITRAFLDDTCGNIVSIYQPGPMARGLVARASAMVNAPADAVWQALVDPAAIKQYMFGAEAVSDWKAGSSITWKGEWEGRRYEDKGVIIALEPGRRLVYSHWSPLSGLEDRPENRHTVTVELFAKEGRTEVSLVQDNNPGEEAKEHSARNWARMLDGLKRYVEAKSSPG